MSFEDVSGAARTNSSDVASQTVLPHATQGGGRVINHILALWAKDGHTVTSTMAFVVKNLAQTRRRRLTFAALILDAGRGFSQRRAGSRGPGGKTGLFTAFSTPTFLPRSFLTSTFPDSFILPLSSSFFLDLVGDVRFAMIVKRVTNVSAEVTIGAIPQFRGC